MTSNARRPGTKLLELIQRALDPGATPDRVKLYAKEVEGVVELFAETTDGVHQITSVANAFGMFFRDDPVTLDVFVDGVNGSDNNDGLTAGTALQTLPAIYHKFPWRLMGAAQVIVHLLNPTPNPIDYQIDALEFGGGNQAIVHTYAFRGPAMVLFVPAAGPSTAALDAVPAVRVDQAGAPSGTGNRTRLDFTVAAPGWAANDLAGSFVRIRRGGVQVFFEIPIVENTADTITVDAIGIVGVLLATDTVEVVQPAVRIVAPPGNPSFGILTMMGFGPTEGVIPATPFSTFERIGFGELWTRFTGVLQFDRCQFNAPLFDTLLIASGASFANCAQIAGSMIIQGNQGCSEATRRPDGGGDPINPAAGLTDLQIAPRVGSTTAGLIIGMFPTTYAPRSTGVLFVSRSLSVYRSFGTAGIHVTGKGSSLWLAPAADNCSLNGSGNAGVGLKCAHDGVARVNGGTLTAITGAAGDLRVQTGAAVAYGTGVGQFQEAAGWNGNFTRMLEGSATAPTGDTSRITTFSLLV